MPPTTTPHHHHCNDSPGRNINQLSSTITAQLLIMPVTPHPKRGHNPPTPHAASPPRHPSTRCPNPPSGHDSQQSSTPPSPPNHPAVTIIVIVLFLFSYCSKVINDNICNKRQSFKKIKMTKQKTTAKDSEQVLILQQTAELCEKIKIVVSTACF
ncbi:hypothetical protein ILYODFUR_026421 [Ilyodon furcidens]|uniref:Transmembrane protein n=1 Tax=Ilyodon furcidens TaxID=33524 RepID=A0ABV0UBK3_9TELE